MPMELAYMDADAFSLCPDLLRSLTVQQRRLPSS